MADNNKGLSDPLADPTEAEVDVVFVHGLNGKREETWTWRGNGDTVFWPRDLLPKDCPTARIFAFGYAADVVAFYPVYGPKQVPSELSIDNYSASLLQDLANVRDRTNTSDRPLIFVAHSLGGLVCANALSMHHGADKDVANLLDRTAGIAFMGTPFAGSSSAVERWSGILRKAVQSLTPLKVHDKDLESLKKGSEKLQCIQRAFLKYLDARKESNEKPSVKVACFIETFDFNRVVGKIVPDASATLPGCDGLPINNSDHTSMCRFQAAGSDGYRSVSGLLSRWIKEIKNPSDTNKGVSVRQGDVTFHDKVSADRGGVFIGQAYGSSEYAVIGIKDQVNNFHGS